MKFSSTSTKLNVDWIQTTHLNKSVHNASKGETRTAQSLNETKLHALTPVSLHMLCYDRKHVMIK